MTSAFPSSPDFTGPLEPVRVEADIFDLEVEGAIPPELDGTFFRVQPDPVFPPSDPEDIFFNGDGAVTAIRFRNGAADLRHRYVRTARFLAERAARRPLFGRYRNRFTADPSVAGEVRSSANTNVIQFNGTLLALKEDSPPYALHPETLETIGIHDFDGRLSSPAFSAHPKIHPGTGDLIAVCYEARGDASRDVVVLGFDRHGRKTREIWIEAPFCGMIHDCAVTQNHVVFPVMPLSVDLDRLRAGGRHFQWEPDFAMLFGVLRIDGDGSDLRWMRGPPGFQGHVLNAFDDGRKVRLDLSIADGNVFPFFPDANGFTTPMDRIRAPLQRWTFDLSANSDAPEVRTLLPMNVEFGRVDDRYAGTRCRHGYLLGQDWSKPYHAASLGPPHPFFFNALVHFDADAGMHEQWWPGPAHSIQEPVFAPRGPAAGEGDGFVIAVVNRLADHRSDIVVLDTRRFADGPVATLHSPLRLRMGLHGNWVPAGARPN